MANSQHVEVFIGESAAELAENINDEAGLQRKDFDRVIESVSHAQTAVKDGTYVTWTYSAVVVFNAR